MLKFLNRLGRGKAEASAFPPVAVTSRVYAIGDVHGRADLLLQLIEMILADAVDMDTPPEVVFIGDYIDRGDQSYEVLELLSTVADWAELVPIFLIGNHEEMMLDFLDQPDLGSRWLRNGGLQTLMSYGVTEFASLQDPHELSRLRVQLMEHLQPHLALLRSLALCHRNGNVFFAHAGADPRLGVDEQPRDTLLWGSPAFMKMPRNDGVWVCHGHTIVDHASAAEGRIAIDTGAFYSGRLTAVRLGTGLPKFLIAEEGDGGSSHSVS